MGALRKKMRMEITYGKPVAASAGADDGPVTAETAATGAGDALSTASSVFASAPSGTVDDNASEGSEACSLSEEVERALRLE